jgi:hypothetical protein
MRVLAILLIVLGALGLAYGGFSYWHRETVVDLGPIHATRDKHESVPIPPVVGGVALAVGVVLLLGGRRAA